MVIEGVSSIQAAGYQMNQPAPRPVEAVSIDPANSAVSVDMAAKVQTVKTSDNADGNQGYESQKRGEASSEQIKKAVSDMNKKMQNTSAQFGIHEDTGRVTIKLVDKETKDVIKEFPAEKTLEMIARVWELAGIMVDEKL
ncbi:MAG: flagellar protein FlaG [Lachnospiraceae bacterium]|nr:flagellar protein FlaG [Lachnospiraceae bacterium]